MSDIISQIRKNVMEYPDFTIIVDQGENNSFTYRAFDAYARRIAAKLSRLGVGRRDFVTIELPRNKEYIAAMYAVWMVGAAFAPLSPNYPEDRLEFIRDNCGAKTVINAKFLRGIEDEEPIAETVTPEPSDPSLLIYTSGSTGKPKGVLHSHASITDSVNRYIGFAKTPAGARAALGAPFTFVASVQGVFAPLCARISAYLMPYEAMRDPILLADYIEENQINRTFISPKMLKVFKQKGDSLKTVYPDSKYVKALEAETARREQLFSLQNRIASAGERAYPALSMPSVTGETAELDSLDAKVKLLWFWDAREASHKIFNLDVLKPLYEQYKSKGLGIYAVCVDPDKAEWAQVVKSQDLPWVNVNDGLGTASRSLFLYNVQRVPCCLLLTEDGITSVNVGEKPLQAALAKLLK